MAEFASPQETQRALEILLELQSEDPNKLDGILNKYANPFTSWPLLKEPTEAFLGFFETPASGTETIGSQKNINPKLEEMMEEFDREFAASKEQRVNASTAAKKFVNALKENAKKANVVLPEAQGAPSEAQGAPVTPERVENIISATLRHQGPPEEKLLVFHALTTLCSERPDASVADQLPRAIAVTETARVLSTRQETFPRDVSFAALATNGVQKNAAFILDKVVPPAAKEAVINKILLEPLDAIVNHPESLPKNILGEMTDRWGSNFVNSAWFTQLRTDANRMIGDQKGMLRVTTRFASFASDVATTVFRGPRIEYVLAYVETYRLTATQGVQMTGIAHYHNIAMGYGGQLIRMGADYAMRAGVKAGIKKAAAGIAAKIGVEAAAGAATGGLATVAMVAADALKGLVNKGAALLKGLLFMGNSKNPEDNLLLIVGAGVVLVFFLPIFPLLNIPAFNQSMIDTSIANSTGGGMESGPIINCQLTPEDPQCKFTACTGDCRWPASGIITQGPRTGQFCSVRTSHTAGSGANGIDIASFSGGPVYTPRAGTVVVVFGSCANNSGHLGDTCGGSPQYAGYGNHVILKTDDGHMLIFGHLESAIGVQAGQHVDAGAQVGWMDQTGNSSGTHLHFGVLAGGNVLDFVPPGNPALSPEAINGCINNTAGCTKTCPTAPVTAGT